MDQQVAFQKKFQNDVWDVVKNIEHHKRLKKSLVQLYKKYVLNEVKNEGNANQDQNKERDFWEENVKHMKEQIQKNMVEN